MTLNELNNEYDDLKYTARRLELAMKKFEGTNIVENYLHYEVLQKARECVISAMDRFVNKDWQ